MTGHLRKRGFVARPSDPESWVKAADPDTGRTSATSSFTARLTIDVTPELRQRLKFVALERRTTVADMLRALLVREFPNTEGGPS
jgi:hypothetical protein